MGGTFLLEPLNCADYRKEWDLLRGKRLDRLDVNCIAVLVKSSHDLHVLTVIGSGLRRIVQFVLQISSPQHVRISLVSHCAQEGAQL